jgi:hypothetical protein
MAMTTFRRPVKIAHAEITYTNTSAVVPGQNKTTRPASKLRAPSASSSHLRPPGPLIPATMASKPSTRA